MNEIYDRSRGPAVVIGGGIVGSFLALHLAQRKIPTVLFDADKVPGGATAGSFAAITAFGREPFSYYLLNCHGMSEWRRWGRRFERDIGLRWGGNVTWTDDPADASRLREQVDLARYHGYQVRLATRRDVERRVPEAEIGPLEAAAVADTDGHVDPALAVEACREAASAEGAVMRTGEIAHLEVEDDGIRVYSSTDAIDPGMVVVAAGAESVAVAGEVGVDVPLVASSALNVVADGVPELARGTVNMPARDGKVQLRHQSDVSVLIVEETGAGVVSEPTNRHAEALVGHVARYFPALSDGHIRSARPVWRSMPADHLPIVGPVPGLPNVYMAVMHAGVTLAPVVGDFAAREIAEGERVRHLEPFRPSRFAARIVETMLEVESIF